MENHEAKEQILTGIVDEANLQAESMLADARTAAQERITAAKSQAERLAKTEETRLNGHVMKIAKEGETKISAAKRRMSLELREQVYSTIVSRCASEFGRLIDSPEYDDILRSWIAEAAAGLQGDAASVTCSKAEAPTVGRILPQAQAEASDIYGRTITLTMSDLPLPSGQGVVITADDGRTAFNNRVDSRMARFETEIRTLIAARLFQDE